MEFAIEKTNIYREVQAVFSSGPNPVIFFWRAQIHVKRKNYNVLKVVSVQFRRNYLNNVFDEIYVDLLLGEGDYIFNIEPFRQDLEITLIKSPLNEVAGSPNLDEQPETQRYKAISLTPSSAAIESNSVHQMNIETANRAQIKTYSFQLMDKVVEKVRTISGGGIFRNTSAALVARTLLTNLSKNLKVENEIAIKGVDLAPKFVTDVKQHIQVPQHTELTKIPKYLHEAYGIYSSGFWYYLQKGYWYMYPTYDLTRYNQSSLTLTVINVPAQRMPNIERSYRKTQTQVIVLSTGETKFTDQAEYKALNEGNAVRFIDADNITANFVQVEGNKVAASIKENVQECVLDNRISTNNIRQSPVQITSNVAFEKSRIAARLGSFIQTTWDNARDDLIYPGMPVKYVYETYNSVHELLGVVVGAEYFSQLDGENMNSTRHTCRSILTLFVDKNLKIIPEDR